MYIANELKIVNSDQYNEEIRSNFIDILEVVITDIIKEKPTFSLENFYARYYDEFSLNTNCNKDTFNTVYLEINQPLNFKPSKLIKKQIKNGENLKEMKISFPELYYGLDEFIEDLYTTFVKTLDSNNIVWKDDYSVCLKTTINENDKSYDYYFRVIPCISYYNQKDYRGQMYKKNDGIEIEYVDIAKDNFENKNKKTKDLFRQTILIFKNLALKEKNISSLPKEIFETMLYNVPNEMFVNDSKETMINIINYVRNNSAKQYKTIDEEDLAFVSIYRSMSLIYVKHIIKIIEKQLLK